MPRPFIPRCVANRPGVSVFKPAGIPARALVQVSLHLDELEALCRVDGKGMEQTGAAASMKVSRATVGRILREARRKVAHALVHGEALVIGPGDAPVTHLQKRKRAAPRAGEGSRSRE